MTKVKDLHMQETVKAALYYVEYGLKFSDLRDRFNKLCQDWNADEYDPDKLSLDINAIARHIADEPWLKDIAVIPARERTWEMNRRVFEEFICKYNLKEREKVRGKHVLDVLRVADPLSRRHIVAQRVVIECIHGLRTEEQLRRLDDLMDKLATNPRMEL